jgi:hypothetical protein
MARGLERRAIFRDDADRDAFVARVAALADAGALKKRYRTPFRAQPLGIPRFRIRILIHTP